MAEPEGKWAGDRVGELVAAVEEVGFVCLPVERSGGFIYVEALKR